jgi:hypothetical protein
MRLADTMVCGNRASPATSGEDGMDRGEDDNPYAPAQSVGPERLRPEPARQTWHWFQVLVAGLLPFNFVVGMLYGAGGSGFPAMPFLASIISGLFPAQAGLLTLWLVWGPRSFGWRLLVHWLIVLAFSLALVIGFAGSFRGTMSEFDLLQRFGILLSFLPAFSLGLQLPLWPLRVYGRWHVERVESNAESGAAPAPAGAQTQASEPLSIRDLLLATLVVAAGIGGLRIAFAAASGPDSPIDSEYWIGWTIGILLLMVFSLVGFLPALFLILRVKRTQLAVGLWYAYLGAPCLALLLLGALMAGPGQELGDFIVVTLLVLGCYATGLALPLLLARRDGWRLRLPGDRAAPADRAAAEQTESTP